MARLSKATENLLKKKEHRFAEWSASTERFIQVHMEKEPVDSREAAREVWMRQNHVCTEIMGVMISGSRITEVWGMPKLLPLPFGGLEIAFPTAKVNDSFWYRLAELDKLGKLEHFGQPDPESRELREAPYLHRLTKSVLFSLVQQALYEEKENGSVDELGGLQVRWKLNTPWTELLTNGGIRDKY